jgi:hypothetical protein
MSHGDIDELDRQLDAINRRTAGAGPDDDLLAGLARLTPLQWPERAMADRIVARLVAAAPSAGKGPRQRGLSRRRLSHRVALVAAAVIVVIAAVTAVIAGSGSAAPVFRAHFSATVLRPARPARPARHQRGQWALIGYFTEYGWHAHYNSYAPNTLSCPSAVLCYLTAAKPVPVPQSPQFDVLEVSRDGGQSWTTLGLPSTMSISTPLQCPESGTICLAGGYDAGRVVLFRTADGGHTWTAYPVPGAVQYADQVSCTSARVCVGIFTTPMTAAGSEVLVTSDGGRTWGPGPALPRGQHPDYLTCQRGTCVLLDQLDLTDNAQSVNGNGPLTVAPGSWAAWVSHDGGIHWQRGRHPASAWEMPGNNGLPESGAIACSDARHCWAVASTSASALGATAVLASTDGGNSWTVQPLPADVAGRFLPESVSCPTARQCWIGGMLGTRTHGQLSQLTSRAVLETGNGGASWRLSPIPAAMAGRPDGTSNLALFACPAAGRCIALPASQTARRSPVFVLSG